jgi:hypothetical protein
MLLFLLFLVVLEFNLVFNANFQVHFMVLIICVVEIIHLISNNK